MDETKSNQFKAKEMKDFYPNAEESIPLNTLEPRGEPVQLNIFVDTNYIGNKVTRQ